MHVINNFFLGFLTKRQNVVHIITFHQTPAPKSVTSYMNAPWASNRFAVKLLENEAGDPELTIFLAKCQYLYQMLI